MPGPAEYAMCALGGLFSVSSMITALLLAQHNSGRRPMKQLAAIFTPQVRQYLYFVILALLPILVTYGILTTDALPLWIALAGAGLGLGTAGAAITKQRNDGTLP